MIYFDQCNHRKKTDDFAGLETSASATSLPASRVRRDWGDVLDAADLHASSIIKKI